MTIKIKSNTRIHNLTFLRMADEKIHGHNAGVFICDCCYQDCIKRVDKFMLGLLKSCGCRSKTKNAFSNNVWDNPNYPFYVMFKGIEKGNKKRKEITIDTEYIKQVWEEQQGKCFYTGIELVLPKSFTKTNNPLSPSIDRIDSSKGYIPGNIQIVHKQANFMKQSLSHEEFINFCKLISSRF